MTDSTTTAEAESDFPLDADGKPITTIDSLADYCDLGHEELLYDAEEFMRQRGLWAAFIHHSLRVHNGDDEDEE